MRCALAAATILALVSAHPARADTNVEAVAAQAGVDATDLEGASLTTGLPPAEYLCAVKEGPCPKPASPRDYLDITYPDIAPRIHCIIEGRGLMPGESGWNPYAKNPRSDASGLLQFMPSTIVSVGHPASDVWNPYASIDAAAEMFRRGRESEWISVAAHVC